MQVPRGMWYLDLYALHHLTINKNLFIKELKSKYLDFTTIDGQILCSKSFGTIVISFINNLSIEFSNIVYACNYNSNLISLGQLCKSGITYINNINIRTLMQSGQPIAHERKDQNLFILHLATPNRTM